ncbi:hypothetical protein LOTGIDRAFT_213480 [Lottia gigantea]|uniref:Ran guanine nucleotide release factor n=1 Tax=Lottia gigantea TaxID=225164 RepID=V4AQL6_LOTGI|nr:hypothetical protein LOTGIDRAFT_213480 [Lottia gigantea]ESO99532.1 hypothetical protein LOTGIDRAFT_213480 [Lottia gigantea]
MSSNGQSEQSLYGGAMTVILPPQAIDVSQIRDVPDNQEVFTHNVTDQSIIFDILEYIEEPDHQAIQSHFQEVAEYNKASDNDVTKIISIEEISKDELLLTECTKAYYVLGQQKVAKFNETAKNLMNLHLGLFRLPQFSTDILITSNDPVIISPESSSHNAIPTSADRWTVMDIKRVITSLKLLDTGLFE